MNFMMSCIHTFSLFVVIGICGRIVHADDTLFQFSIKDPNGHPQSLDIYKGMVTLVVNVASECGYTNDNYKQLVQLQKDFAYTKMFSVLAFPCNQFGKQEPGRNKDIVEFAVDNFGVNFPIFAKINVKGRAADPMWTFLTETSGVTPEWNFTKYLLGVDGKVISTRGPQQGFDGLYEEIKLLIQKAAIENPPNGRVDL